MITVTAENFKTSFSVEDAFQILLASFWSLKIVGLQNNWENKQTVFYMF